MTWQAIVFKMWRPTETYLTVTDGKTLLETVCKRAGTLKEYLDKLSASHRPSQADSDQSDQQTIWPAEPAGKSNSYWSQSGEEQKHLFRQSSLSFEGRKTLQVW